MEEQKKDILDANTSEEIIHENGTPVSPLHDELTTCKAQLDEWRNKYLHIQADFDNFTRRNEKERLLWMQQAQAKILKDLLPIVDNFDRAVIKPNNQSLSAEMQSWIAGIDLIAQSMHKFLTSQGVEEINCKQQFDPKLHEALVQVYAPNLPSGSIVDVLQKGYLFRGDVLRPAQVSVAR